MLTQCYNSTFLRDVNSILVCCMDQTFTYSVFCTRARARARARAHTHTHTHTQI